MRIAGMMNKLEHTDIYANICAEYIALAVTHTETPNQSRYKVHIKQYYEFEESISISRFRLNKYWMRDPATID